MPEHSLNEGQAKDAERLRADAALRESEERLRLALSAANQGMYDLDTRTGVATVTPEYLSMIGEDPSAGTFDLATFGDRIHPDDAPEVLGLVEAYTRGDIDEYRTEYRIRHTSGEWIWVLSIGRVIERDNEGQAVRVLGTHTDITDRRKAELAVLESERRHRIILQAAMDGFCLVDVEGHLLEVNDAYSQMSGYACDELLGMKIFDFEVDEAAADTLGHLHYVMEQGEDRFESVHRRKDGTTFDVEVSVQYQPAIGERFWVFVRDITERKASERALNDRVVSLTQPLTDDTDVDFENLFVIDDIQQLQDAFSNATQVASIITHVDGTPITKPSNFCRLCNELIRGTEIGRANCYASDAELGKVSTAGPSIRPCMSAGLWDAGASITVGGHHIANWLIGQVRDDTQSEELIVAYAREIGADEQAMIEAFHDVPAMSREHFESIADALYLLASQLSATAYQNVQQARAITERLETEQALRASERWLSESQRVARLGHYIFDIPADHWYGSPSLYDVLGVTEPGGDFTAWLNVVHSDDRDWVTRYFAEDVLGEGHTFDAEYRIVRPRDGEIRWVHGLGVLEHGEDGQPLSMFGIIQDITERKTSEEEIRTLNASLEERVQARTEELSRANNELAVLNEELTEANYRLEEATRAKNDFLAAMSHELRTPLNSVIGFSTILGKEMAGELNDEQRKQIGMIDNSGRHLLELVNKILDLAKIEAGQHIPTIREVDIAEVAQRMFETVRPMAEAKDIEMQWNCPESEMLSQTDELFVSQILLNLMGNAVKFSDSGRVSVTLSREDSDVLVTVKDTGRGIAQEDLERVFDDFYQVDPYQGAKSDGTGLGLSVSRHLADILGARIEVESELGRGSRFTLRLPG